MIRGDLRSAVAARSGDLRRRLAATYQALTAAQVRETAARIFSATPTIATVLPGGVIFPSHIAWGKPRRRRDSPAGMSQ